MPTFEKHGIVPTLRIASLLGYRADEDVVKCEIVAQTYLTWHFLRVEALHQLSIGFAFAFF